MEFLGKVGTADLSSVNGAPVGIIEGSRTPVKSRSKDIITAVGIVIIITTAFHDINLTRRRPTAILVFLRHHPDGRPKPIALWKLCSDLNLTILDELLTLGCETSRHDRVDHGSFLLAANSLAVQVGFARAGGLCEVDSMSIKELLLSNVGNLGRELRNNVETFRVGEGDLVRVGGPVESAISNEGF